MTLESNKALIRHVFEDVIPAGDPTAMRDLVAADFLDHDPLPGQPPGGAGAEYVVSTMHTAHPDLRFAIDDLVAEGARDPRLPDRDGLPIVLCGQGFQSSLAARELQQLGFARATDVIGGFAGWAEAGLPVVPYGTGAAMHAIAGGPGSPHPGAYA